MTLRQPTLMRLIVLAYHRDDPRRREALAELRAVPRWERPLWVCEQLEVAIFEGLHERFNRQGRKRLFDVIAAAMLLIILAPALACMAFVVRVSSPGPAIVRHRRLGKDGREIQVLGFRRETQVLQFRTQCQFTSVHREARVTPVGRWLRTTSLDQLPQLVNVLRGDMSLVGPPPSPDAPADGEHLPVEKPAIFLGLRRRRARDRSS